MTLEEAQERLSKAQARLRKWYVLNTSVVPPDDYTLPIRDLEQKVVSLKKQREVDRGN